MSLFDYSRGSSSADAWSLELIADAHRTGRAAADRLEKLCGEISALSGRVAWQSPAADVFQERTRRAGLEAVRLVGDVAAACDALRILESRVQDLLP